METCKDHSGICEAVKGLKEDISYIKEAQKDSNKLLIGTLITVGVQLLFFVMRLIPFAQAKP